MKTEAEYRAEPCASCDGLGARASDAPIDGMRTTPCDVCKGTGKRAPNLIPGTHEWALDSAECLHMASERENARWSSSVAAEFANTIAPVVIELEGIEEMVAEASEMARSHVGCGRTVPVAIPMEEFQALSFAIRECARRQSAMCAKLRGDK